MKTDARPILPAVFVDLCRAAGADPWSHAGLPATTDAIERATKDAITAEAKNAPQSRAGIAFGVPSFEHECRATVREARAELRRIEYQLTELQHKRDRLKLLLTP